MGVESALGLLRKVMLIWLRRKLTKVLGNFLNHTSYAQKKLKGTVQVRCDVVSRAYKRKYAPQWKHLKTMGGVKEDEYVVAENFCIQI